MNNWQTFLTGIFLGSFLMGILMNVFTEQNEFYIQGVKETHKEAFENGLMTKEITKDDKVIYKWRELHDLNYE
jgi:hypothetical protein